MSDREQWIAEAVRREFEAWHRAEFPNDPMMRSDVYGYRRDQVANRWIGWRHAMRARLATRPSVPEWLPIETAPKDGTRVLLVSAEGTRDIAEYIEQWAENDEFVRKAKDGDVYKTVREDRGYWNTGFVFDPTHWMPLPAAPKQENQHG